MISSIVMAKRAAVSRASETYIVKRGGRCGQKRSPDNRPCGRPSGARVPARAAEMGLRRAVAWIPARQRAAPSRFEIGRRQRVLRGRRGDRAGLVRAELFVEELVEHLGTGLRTVADRDRGL